MADTKISALSAGTAAPGDEIPVNRGGSNFKITAGDILKINGGTITADSPVLNLTQTWNNAAVTFTGLKFNATDTTSASGSLLMDLQVGGTSKFKVDKIGNAFIGETLRWARANTYIYDDSGAGFRFSYSNTFGIYLPAAGGLKINSVGLLAWTDAQANGTADTILARDAAGTLAQRNAANAQTFRLYGTYDDASNYRRLFITSTTAGAFTIGVQGLGTGASGNTLTVGQLALGSDTTTLSSKFKVGNSGSQYFVHNGTLGWKLPIASSNGATDVSFGVLSNTLFASTASGQFAWTTGNYGTDQSSATVDTGLARSAAAVVKVTNGSTGFGSLELGRTLTGTDTDPALFVQGDWSTTGTATLIKANVATDTGPSNASSLLMDLQVGGSSKFSVEKSGSFFAGSSGWQKTGNELGYKSPFSSSVVALFDANFFKVRAANYIGWGSNAASDTTDLILARDAANTLAQRNGNNTQTFRLYGRYTDATNDFERFHITASSTSGAAVTLGTQKGVTAGTARALELQTDGTTRLTLDTSGNAALTGYLQIGSSSNQRIVNPASNQLALWTAGAPILLLKQTEWNFGQWSGTGKTIKIDNQAGITDRNGDPLTIDVGGGSGSGTSGYFAVKTAPSTTSGTTGHVSEESFRVRTPTTGVYIASFGGTTSSFPALKRSSATLIARLADDSANAAFESASLKTDAPTGGTAATWKLGAVASVSPTSPNRTIEVDIGGTIYYLHAKTTND